MKKAKSFKLIILSVAFCFSLLLGALFFNSSAIGGEAKANYKTDTSKYFDTTASVSYDDTNLVISAKDGEKLSIVNPLVISDFAIEVIVPEGATSLEVEFKSDSFVLHGNKNASGKFDKKISNVIKVNFEDNTATLNDVDMGEVTLNGGVLTITTSVTNNAFTANVGTNGLTATGDYYKIAGNQKSIGYVSLTFGVDGEDAKDFKIVSIDQSYGNLEVDNKQTFVTENDDIKSLALPEFVVDASLYNSNNDIVVRDGEELNLNMTAYSVYGNVGSSDLYISKSLSADEDINVKIIGESKQKTVILNKKDGATRDTETLEILCGEDKVVGSIDVKVIDLDYVEKEMEKDISVRKTPKYQASEEAIEAYLSELEKAIKVGDKYVALGKTIELPSLKGFVEYDYLPFEKLKYTVYVNSPNDENKTSTSMKVKVDVPGEYKFYVMFYDGDISMPSPIDDDEIMKGDELSFVFSFKIEDNASLVVTPNENMEGTNGYVGVRYSAVPFNIEAESFTPVYTLWYNENAEATADSEGWIKVLKKSEVNSNYDEEKEFFTKEEIETINYDGKLDFTPVKVGSYKIDCEVSKGISADSAAASYVVKVTEPKLKVKPENKWLKNNMVSIVFLGVGTLCLIGIIILLCIKPKERTKKVTDED